MKKLKTRTKNEELFIFRLNSVCTKVKWGPEIVNPQFRSRSVRVTKIEYGPK
jgi:hypothetical protein